jgi:hypothetical protein
MLWFSVKKRTAQRSVVEVVSWPATSRPDSWCETLVHVVYLQESLLLAYLCSHSFRLIAG